MNTLHSLDRRRLLLGSGALAASAALSPLFPAWAQSAHARHHGGTGPYTGRNSSGVLSGEDIALTIGETRY